MGNGFIPIDVPPAPPWGKIWRRKPDGTNELVDSDNNVSTPFAGRGQGGLDDQTVPPTVPPGAAGSGGGDGGGNGGGVTLPQETVFTASGTYTIPPNCDAFDYIVVSGGGAADDTTGGGGSFMFGASFVRGTDIPLETTSVNVTIGQGGIDGYDVNEIGAGSGGPTTSDLDGLAPLEGWIDNSFGSWGQGASGAYRAIRGGSGVNGWPPLNGFDADMLTGPGSNVFTFNGRDYVAGGWQTTPGAAGNAPGGGGCVPDGVGARGQAWFWAYKLTQPAAAPMMASLSAEAAEEEPDLQSWTRAELMAALDQLDIEYPSNARKAELIELLEQAEE